MEFTGKSFLETAPQNGRRLRIEFHPCENRLESSIKCSQEHSWIALLHSRAPIGDVEWPRTPPWQELHVHEPAGESRVLMLVGRAGTSHWSMAVCLDQSRQAIVFDVACRVRAMPEFLGSTHQLAAPAKLIAGRAVLDVGLLNAKIFVEPLSIDDVPSATVDLQGDEVIVRPLHSPQAPATMRWKYCIRAVE